MQTSITFTASDLTELETIIAQFCVKHNMTDRIVSIANRALDYRNASRGDEIQKPLEEKLVEEVIERVEAVEAENDTPKFANGDELQQAVLELVKQEKVTKQQVKDVLATYGVKAPNAVPAEFFMKFWFEVGGE